MAVIEIEGLHKEYRRRRGTRSVALDGLDLAVPEGGVFGFLGPNGSGKTTTIRCMLGLVRPTRGRCEVFGTDVRHDPARVLPRVGSIVEAPALFPGFSGRRNLSLLGSYDRIGPRAVDAILDRVGLADRADDPVRGYSLGMRQRLAIGAALLKDPALVILDEPANGLDPAGMVEVRSLVRSLAADGRTVFVSSHLLSEVQQTCDRVAILTRGRCVASGPVREVLAAGKRARLRVRVADVERGVEVLCAAGILAAVRDGEIRVDMEPADAARVTEVLARAGLFLSELRPEEADLEDVFLEITRRAEAVPA